MNAPLLIPHYRNDKLYWAIYATKDEGKKGVDLSLNPLSSYTIYM